MNGRESKGEGEQERGKEGKKRGRGGREEEDRDGRRHGGITA